MTKHKRLLFLVFFGFCISLVFGTIGYAGGEQVSASSGAQISNWSAPVYADCKSDCNAELKRGTKECDTFYPPSSRPDDHTKCLDRVKTKYDSCVAACKS